MPAQAHTAPTSSNGQQIELHDIQNPVVRRVYELWQQLRGSRSFPRREDITPRRMPELLRNIALVRVLDGGEEFQIRLVGDAIVQAQGATFHGMTTRQIDLVLPGYGSALARLYGDICKNRRPRAYRGWYERQADKHSFFHESVLLPLGPDDRTVDHVLIGAVYARHFNGLH